MLKRINSCILSAILLTMILADSTSAQGQKKTAYAVLIDNSWSMQGQFQNALLIGKGVIERLHQRGPVTVFNFRGENDLGVAEPGLEWSQDKKALIDYVDSLSMVRGRADLFLSIQTIAERLDAKVSSDTDTFGDKAVILITDGEDRILRAKEPFNAPQDDTDARRKIGDRLIKMLKSRGVRVYPIGLTRDLDDDLPHRVGLKFSKEQAERFLKKMAKETGARAVLPQSKKIDVDALLNKLAVP